MSQNTTFITGDRSSVEVFTTSAAVLSAVARGDKLATGDNKGVEDFVRELAQRADIEVDVRATPLTEEGYRDFPALHAQLKEEGVKVVYLHPDPASSRIGQSLVEAGLLEA